MELPLQGKMRLLALSNILYFIPIMLVITDQFEQITTIFRFMSVFFIFLDGLLTIVTLIDFYKFVKKSLSIIFYLYIPITFFTRLILLIEVYFPSRVGVTIVIYAIGSSSIFYGLILFEISLQKKFAHVEKFRVLSYANLMGITTLLLPMYPNIAVFYLGIKLFLPLPTAFVFFIMSFDIDFSQKIYETKWT